MAMYDFLIIIGQILHPKIESVFPRSPFTGSDTFLFGIFVLLDWPDHTTDAFSGHC